MAIGAENAPLDRSVVVSGGIETGRPGGRPVRVEDVLRGRAGYLPQIVLKLSR